MARSPEVTHGANGSSNHLATLPDRRASQNPDGLAITDGTQSLTNEHLHQRVNAIARQLRDLDIKRGDVVALKLTNRIDFVTLLFSSWRLGATVTPINPSLTEVEVARQLGETGVWLSC